jgi:hypothetical protein
MECRLRPCIPASLIDREEYSRHVAIKCFALSTQLGSPTFFLSFMINLCLAEYHTIKRGSESFVDSAMNSVIIKVKLSVLMKFIKHRQILAKVSAFVWRIEYQKGGFPDAHMLFWGNFDT